MHDVRILLLTESFKKLLGKRWLDSVDVWDADLGDICARDAELDRDCVAGLFAQHLSRRWKDQLTR